jgi:hypothetical protein
MLLSTLDASLHPVGVERKINIDDALSQVSLSLFHHLDRINTVEYALQLGRKSAKHNIQYFKHSSMNSI